MQLPGKIDRYIAAEVAWPALLGLAIFTLVLLLGRIVKIIELIVAKGVALSDILNLLSFLLPTFFSITVPLAFLLGILLGFTRLSSDCEIIALKASGVGLSRMLWPVVALALIASLLTAWSTLYAQPLANRAFRAKLYAIANQHVDAGLQPAVFNDDFNGLIIYANAIDEQGQLHDIFISDERNTGNAPLLLASSGRIVANNEQMSLQLELQEGSIHRRQHEAAAETYQLIQFGEYRIDLALASAASGAKQPHYKNKELTLAQLLDKSRTDQNQEQQRSSLAEFNQRLALPFAPLLFSLIGIPLGIQSSRSGRGGGFTLALVIALAYFMLLTTGRTLAEQNHLPVILCMWLPNIVFLVLGVALFRQACHERHFFLLTWILTGMDILLSTLRRRAK
ncbi:MAG: LPS export ABC transporter permease LptF [Desulfuromonadaceae bacterium]|nr:LPS export ABC transporter permease LptF [Desulfuromonadaceae bacterium]